MQLLQSIHALLAQHDALVILALAAAGCGLQAGAALLLTWLWIKGYTARERAVFS